MTYGRRRQSGWPQTFANVAGAVVWRLHLSNQPNPCSTVAIFNSSKYTAEVESRLMIAWFLDCVHGIRSLVSERAKKAKYPNKCRQRKRNLRYLIGRNFRLFLSLIELWQTVLEPIPDPNSSHAIWNNSVKCSFRKKIVKYWAFLPTPVHLKDYLLCCYFVDKAQEFKFENFKFADPYFFPLGAQLKAISAFFCSLVVALVENIFW